MKKILCLIILSCVSFIPLFSAGAEKGDSWRPLLQSAEMHFRQGIEGDQNELMYALQDYQGAMKEGAPEDYRIFYNWANTLLLTGSRGRAASLYRKVLFFKPGHSNAAKNLNLIEKDNPIETENQGVVKVVLFGILYLIGYEPSLYLGLFLFVLSWGILISDLFLKKKRMITLFAVLLSLSLWDLSLCLVWNQSAAQSGVVITEQTVLKKGDSRAYESVHSFGLPAGTPFKLLEEREGWILVRLMDSSEGWIERTDIKMVLEDY